MSITNHTTPNHTKSCFWEDLGGSLPTLACLGLSLLQIHLMHETGAVILFGLLTMAFALVGIMFGLLELHRRQERTARHVNQGKEL